jgi:hypothetical protein
LISEKRSAASQLNGAFLAMQQAGGPNVVASLSISLSTAWIFQAEEILQFGNVLLLAVAFRCRLAGSAEVLTQLMEAGMQDAHF